MSKLGHVAYVSMRLDEADITCMQFLRLYSHFLKGKG